MENQRMGNRLMKNQLMATPLQTRWRNVPLDGSPKQPYYGHANRSTMKQHAFFTARMSFMSAVSHISAPLPVRYVENHSLFTDSHHRPPVRIHASHQVLSLRPTSVDTLLSEAFDLSCRLLLSQMGGRKPDRVENHRRRPPQDTLSTLLSKNVTSFAKESATG